MDRGLLGCAIVTALLIRVAMTSLLLLNKWRHRNRSVPIWVLLTCAFHCDASEVARPLLDTGDVAYRVIGRGRQGILPFIR
jgi:hypothetical protein